jgi:putative colanic acid biosysnthesis UDP-glucose lipid carrier transferase
MDIRYIENWTFWMDLKIILLTMLTILKGEINAY